jgi:predicted dehydrogenase
MEAMWTRFIPAIVNLRERVHDGAIGDVRFLEADFGFRAGYDPQSRLFAPQLGGGALLDLGVYLIHLAFMLCGAPTEISATATLGETGVDEEAAIRLRHENGAVSQLYCSLRADTHREARIVGTEGRVTLPAPWWSASRFIVDNHDAGTRSFDFENRGGGYAHQAEQFMEVIRSGRKESCILPLAETLAVMQTMDEIRDGWGLRYPSE